MRRSRNDLNTIGVTFLLIFRRTSDCEQSLVFLLSSSSRGKTSRTPVRGNLGEEKQLILIFLAQVSARRYLGCLSAARRTQEENRDYSQSRRMFTAAPNRNLYFHAKWYLNQWLEVQRFLHGLERFLVDAFLTNTKAFHQKSLVFIWIIPDKTNALSYHINTDRSIMRGRLWNRGK